MSTLAQQMEDFARRKRQEYDAVMEGAAPPPCQALVQIGNPERCGVTSEAVSKGITPAGYHFWCCAKHRPRDESEADLWGSDPGWPTAYETVAEARARYAQND
jgi:hypothetical protein